MHTIQPGFFRVTDGEVITFDIRSTGAPTLFGVNFSIFGTGSPIPEGQLLHVTMDKSRATGSSNISNARSTTLTLLFSFSSNNGGRYDWTVTGSEGGTFDDFARQAGSGPESVTYTFHIV
ncbi:MAG: hypothetical protein LC794_18235 [Acidobacteria bacterium]|nr:hypothetical protein [Acidobacteriota bacterium]